ncbi:hypothetical protein PCC7418_0388 [Halothece sp. PCC 7418]|uniref:DUF4278 domain-containing protein n=1 Tax=Halothece sp. (strain PCC 7418) TaxID=65093 RepID=UPI0002A07C3D|nr:DUF4278 domain-containing protein [Halothece sp. PCC 7418]AFZ42622.1 hypothetical protein PCC7418_0388 [Halothece sp. PCC 7418]
MRLTYRGINYETETMPLETTEGEVVGTYRGQPWRDHYPRHIPELEPKLWLQYRGVNYSKRPVVQSSHRSDLPIPAVTPHSELPSPRHFTTQNEESEAANAHLESIRRNLERRISVAREQGNEHLLSMLEQEYRDLAISH